MRGIPGHEEIELALMRLYRVTGDEKYKETAGYFLNERGTEPNYFAEEVKKRDGWSYWHMDPEGREYAQNHKPVKEQDKAVGHAVRAAYLYTGMADYASESGDAEMYEACKRLWRNIVDRQMYVTGGIGATVHGEAFSIDYELPNDLVYAETCASVAMAFFARRMLEIEPKGEYADILEKELYNGILSGMQLDGKRFFYVNPLEVVPGVSGELPEYKHVLPERPGWYACACCPPNVARLVTSLAQYAWGENETSVYAPHVPRRPGHVPQRRRHHLRIRLSVERQREIHDRHGQILHLRHPYSRLVPRVEHLGERRGSDARAEGRLCPAGPQLEGRGHGGALARHGAAPPLCEHACARRRRLCGDCPRPGGSTASSRRTTAPSSPPCVCRAPRSSPWMRRAKNAWAACP